MVNGCSNKEITDPFWGINLDWKKDKIVNELSEWSKSGEITNCVFSFEKTTYLKDTSFDARVTCSLNNPQFDKNILKKLSYSLSVNFKNESIAEFNTDFYEYFKKIMKGTYGNSFQESNNDDEIELKWNVNYNKQVNVNILKSLNHYSVVIQV